MRALQVFCIKENYIPIATELYVYSDKYNIAGTLDDVGMMPDKNGKMQLVLMDLKTSNQFKDSYFLQVTLYWYMFKKLTGLIPKRNFILKLNKEDGTYKIEDILRIGKIA